MQPQISQVLALNVSRSGAEQIRQLVGAAPLARLAGMTTSFEEFERTALKLQPEVLLVEFPEFAEGLEGCLERVRRLAPRSHLMTLSDCGRPEHIVKAVRLGAREYLSDPFNPQEFNQAVLRLVRSGQASGQPMGRVLGVIGCKGGVGTSVVALNLAWSLSQDLGRRVALVDMDVSCGDLAALLDQEPPRTLSDVVSNFDRLDSLLMDSLLAEAAPNLRLLASPADPVAAELVEAQHVARAMDHLVDSHQDVIVDLPCRLDEAALAALDRCQAAFLVAEPTVVGLRASRRMRGLLGKLGMAEEKVSWIVNRFGARGSLSQKAVIKALGGGEAAFLPEDSRALWESVNAGQAALAAMPRAKWCKCVRGLASGLAATAQVEVAA